MVAVQKKDPQTKRVRKGVYACAKCGVELNEVTVKNQDPFCSVACCHAYHGVEILVPFQGVTVGSSS
jgi:hypothetical protein